MTLFEISLSLANSMLLNCRNVRVLLGVLYSKCSLYNMEKYVSEVTEETSSRAFQCFYFLSPKLSTDVCVSDL